MRAINVLLAIAISLLLFVLTFEGGLRVIGMAPPRTINQFDSATGWTKRPGATARKSTREYDVTFEINELGLRDDPMESPAKPAGAFRVLCLGDSFTLGYTVERENLFVDQLERWWKSENRRVNVINAGTEGYSTDQQAVWLKEHGEEFAPDVVLLFPYDNDLYWNGQESYGGFPKPRFDAQGRLEERVLDDPGERGWLRKTAIGHLASKLVEPPDQTHRFSPAGSERMIEREFAVVLDQPPGFITDAVARTGGALRFLAGHCRDLDARLVVVPLPSHSAIYPAHAERFGRRYLGLEPEEWNPDLPVGTMLELCGKLGIETLDCRPALRAAAEAGEQLYFDVDWHLNETGNLALAGFLHRALDVDLAVFPEGHRAMDAGIAPRIIAPAPSRTWLKVFGVLWVLLTALYYGTYPDERKWQPPLKVCAMLTAVFCIVLGGEWLLGCLPASLAQFLLLIFVVGLAIFILYKLGRRLGTILELFKAFTLRGHWYLMPLVVVLLTIGSLLVVAASSPLVAPFIYTLF
ncbi:MAG: hypothetical protein CMJ84_09050 [Planctomycetes bacterium]|jgi:hypothetical protein|nr:hypothetical protein [Planctomycetota bacterium]MDP6410609.1 DUF5989 family protein [Planctomycetota bacterium]